MGRFVEHLPLLLMSVAVILDIVAIAIPYWSVSGSGDNQVEWGLWKVCTNGTCNDTPFDAELRKMRALHMFSLVGGAIALVVYIIREHVRWQCFREKVGKALVIILCVKTGVFITIADIYMGKSMILYPACHAMSMVAAIFFLFVGGFLCTPPNLDAI